MARCNWRRWTAIQSRCGSALWAATDQAYKAALAAYAQKQAALKQVQTPPQGRRFQPRETADFLAGRDKAETGRGGVDRAHGTGQRALQDRAKALRATCNIPRRSSRARHAPTLAGNLARGRIVRKAAEEYQGAFGAGTQGCRRDAAGPLVCLDGEHAERSRRGGGIRKTCDQR